MTLIEVVAGLVILGTILAALSIARGRFTRHWAEADRKLAATKALDALVTQWTQGPQATVPINRQGRLPGSRTGIWKTRALRNLDADKLNATVVRVEIFDRGDEVNPSSAPIAALDLLVHRVPAARGAPGTLLDDQRAQEVE